MIKLTPRITTWVVIGITVISFFFFLFRLQDTQLFMNDTARDTLRALRIWQGKEITLIGASASFSENTVKEIYFGSAYLYTAIAGMLVLGFSPLGAVIPNTLLFTLSVPVFYLLARRFSKDKFFIFLATAIYALSPVTVTHARFFWNPNLLIPISVFFWYLALSPKESKHFILKLLMSGILVGVMVNFHYFAVIPIFLFCLYLLVSKKFDKLIFLCFGFFLGSLPLIIFELRNNFYLTNAFIYNFNPSIRVLSHGLGFYFDGFFKIILSVIGLSHGEIVFPVLFSDQIFKIISGIALFMLIAVYFARKHHQSNLYWLWFCLFPTIIFTLYTSTYDLYLRYLFSVFPLLILFVTGIFCELKYSYLSLILFVPILFSDYFIVSATVSMKDGFISLPKIEAISKAIVSDNPTGKYNITENIHGDARATAFRYFLLRDAKVKPQDEIYYGDVKTLYVVSPSLEKTYQDNRWELSSSGPKRLDQTTDFGEVKLFKLVSESNN